MRFSGLVSGIFETTTTRVISSAAITPTKISKSRIISAIVDSVSASGSSLRSTLRKPLSPRHVERRARMIAPHPLG